MSRRLWLALVLSLACSFIVGGVAVAIVQRAEEAPSDPNDPTERGRAMKATDAAATPRVALTPTAVCPVDAVVCELASDMAAQVSASPADLTRFGRPAEVACPSRPSPALGPLCSPGATVHGYFTGVFGKAYGLVDEAGLKQFIAQSASAGKGDYQVLAVGCPVVNEALECGRFAAITLGQRDPESVLVVLLSGAADGLKLIGVRSWSPTTPEAMGGVQQFEQLDLPYQGPIGFVPVSLP